MRKSTTIIYAIWGLTILFLIVVPTTCSHMSRETVQTKILDKDRVVTDESSKYLVYGETEVFENTDSILEGKFSSSDIQGHLVIGECYQLEVYGWRVPFLSRYRNIVESAEVECER